MNKTIVIGCDVAPPRPSALPLRSAQSHETISDIVMVSA